ncbi:MAG: hypothetical protein O7D30_05440 [Rickettsia endosymbiont of Ixodes persulcatus]|nr:hypothetical protein [Rickettsia endosymbiont of Ixodes persulcatus]
MLVQGERAKIFLDLLYNLSYKEEFKEARGIGSFSKLNPFKIYSNYILY